jgi:hypothetical protein
VIIKSESAVKASTQILIITHASKNVSEQGLKDPLVYPGAPHTKLLDQVFENLENFIGLNNAVISFDHKIDCPISTKYLANLRIFCESRHVRLVVSPTSLQMHNQLTATAAFLRGIRDIDSEYVLLFEHDHYFLHEVDWGLVDSAFAEGIKMLRFNEFHNTSRPESFEIVSRSPASTEFCETNYYCNKPYLAKTEFCRQLFEFAERDVPTWNGHFGSLVEGPIMRQIMADEFNLDHDEFRRRYPIALYGSIGAPPMIEHVGVFPGRRARWTKALKGFFKRG